MEVSAANSLLSERVSGSLGVAKASAASSLNDPRLFKTETETTETVPDRETETTETVPDRETETETGETNRPLFLIVCWLLALSVQRKVTWCTRRVKRAPTTEGTSVHSS